MADAVNEMVFIGIVLEKLYLIMDVLGREYPGKDLGWAWSSG